MSSSKRRAPARGYLARIIERQDGRQRVLWYGGYFRTQRERDDAVARARIERPWDVRPASQMTGDEVADAYLADYAKRPGTGADGRIKDSSVDTTSFALKAFRRTFGKRVYASITREEAKAWARSVPPTYIPRAITLGKYAEDELEIDLRNPFRGLASSRGRGRADRPLPDLEVVLRACAVHGAYAAQMAAFILVAAFTGMRPGELYSLRWRDVDLDRQEVTVGWRLYRGKVDRTKNGKTKVIYLPTRARDALLALAAERMTQDPTDPTLLSPDGLVFLTKRGKRMRASTLSQYWEPIRTAAGFEAETDFYLATKHFGVNLLWKEGASERAIQTQMGWSDKTVENLLKVYGHKEEATREELRALDRRRETMAQA